MNKRDNVKLIELLAHIVHDVGGDGEVTAVAADGTRVNLGNLLYAPKALLNYLSTHPTPDTW